MFIVIETRTCPPCQTCLPLTHWQPASSPTELSGLASGVGRRVDVRHLKLKTRASSIELRASPPAAGKDTNILTVERFLRIR